MILRWLASVLVVLFVAAAGVVAALTMTEAGSAWVAEEIEAFSDGAVRLDGVGGTLRGGLRVAAFAVRAGTTHVAATDVVLRVSARNLLGGRLVLRELAAGSVVIEIAADPQDSPQPFVMPTLAAPVPVVVEALHLGRLGIRAGDTAVEFQRVALAGAWVGTRLRVHRLGALFGPLAFGVSGEATLGPGLPLDAQLAWRLDTAALAGAGRVHGELARLQVRQVLLGPGPVSVTGTLAGLPETPRLDALVRWDELHRELPGVGAVHSTAGRLEVAGEPAAWRATLAAGLELPGWPAAQVAARAHGDTTRLVFERLDLDGDFGKAVARGVLGLDPAWRLRLEAVVPRLRIEALRPGLRGELAARLQLETAAGEDTRLRVRDLRGRLMDRPLAGAGDLQFGSGTVAFKGLHLEAGPNRLRADGTLGDRLAGQFELVAPELGVLWPGLRGSLQARGSLAGSRARPVVDVVAGGEELALDDVALTRFDLRLRTDRGGRAQAALRAHALRIGGQALGDLDAALDGETGAHQLTVTLAGPLLDLRTTSHGGWNGSRLEHRLTDARLGHTTFGDWTLAGEPAIGIGAGTAAIGSHCWVQAPAELCVEEALWSAQRARLTARLRDFDLQRFAAWFPPDLAMTGVAQADVAVALAGGVLTGAVAWRQHGTMLYYTGGDEPLVTPLETVDFAVTLAADATVGTLAVIGAEGLHLEAHGRMTGAPAMDTPLEARVQGALPDIAPLLPLFAPDVELAEVAGRFDLDATVGGSLARPRLTGAMRFSGGAAALPVAGVKIEDIEIALTGDGSDAYRLQGTARAGGLLRLNGELRPLEAGGPQAVVHLRGERLDAVRLTDRYVQASPDFTLRWAAAGLAVDGSVAIPRAEIVVRALPATAASPSPDTVVMDRTTAMAPPETATPIRGEIALTLGRDVRLKAFGLDTLLEGTVKLSQGPDGEPRGFGVVRLMEGKFGAYGKELTIEHGTLGFAGPLDDPAVNLRASRRVDWEGKTVVAGIVLSGTASRPESRLFSEPAMSEADAISYLISGRPMQSANANDRSAIAGAALSLGVAQTSPLTQKLGSAVTLDELGLEGGTLDETEVVAGKQLNDDLYLRFTYGLFNRIGTVLARYRIGRGLSIEAASGEDQSLDLIWSVERD